MPAPRFPSVRRFRSGRIIVKVGSSVLTDPKKGGLSNRVVRRLAAEISEVIHKRRWCYVVSSGAIAVGMDVLNEKSRPRTIPGLQAAAAAGQSKLVEAWAAGFRRFDIPVAQVLLTHDDLSHRQRFLNARQALSALRKKGAVAVINENDSVAFEEIALGDNDRLAAQVSNLVDADLLVFLTTARGLIDDAGAVVTQARALDRSLENWVRPVRSKMGSGGMQSKLEAARVAANRGAHVAILDGSEPGALGRLLAGEPTGTLLVPDASKLRSRHHWIAHSLKASGTLHVDAGAAAAVGEHHKSLLPSGLVLVEGKFGEGAAVDIVDPSGTVIARGLARYSAQQLREIAGLSSGAIRAKLGFSLGAAAVHKDDLVLL